MSDKIESLNLPYKQKKVGTEEIINRELEQLFNKYDNGYERVKDMASSLDKTLVEYEQVLSPEEKEKVKEMHDSLAECEAINNREEFIKKVRVALEPMVKIAYDPKYQSLRREKFGKDLNRINEILFYETAGDCVFIHLAPAKDINPFKMRTLIKDGLNDLAGVVKNNEDIKVIRAESWIIATDQGKKLIGRMGFEIENPNGKNDDTVGKAEITRDNFLANYL